MVTTRLRLGAVRAQANPFFECYDNKAKKVAKGAEVTAMIRAAEEAWKADGRYKARSGPPPPGSAFGPKVAAPAAAA